MVRCLCCLRNWLIDEVEGDDIPISIASDECAIVNRGGNVSNTENALTNVMVDGGNHLMIRLKSIGTIIREFYSDKPHIIQDNIYWTR